MADSTLQAIKNKVRRITRRLSEAQLTDAQLTQYINTYVLYDFPETLRLFNLKTTFSFYTLPFVDTYSTTNSAFPNNPLYNFTNKYITTDTPVYIAGYSAMFSQSREQFYGIYPIVNNISSIGLTGNGTQTSFTGVINSQQANVPANSTQIISLLQNEVLFSSVDSNGNGLAMQDTPILDATTGSPTIYGMLYNALTTNTYPYNVNPTIGLPLNPNGIQPLYLLAPYTNSSLFPTTNYINYVTGEFFVTFPTPPAPGVPIDSRTVPTNPTLPLALLFFDGKFIVRPVPDQPYRIDMEVFVQPAELLQNNQNPELNEWWQLIAWNASKKIFEDNNDFDDVQRIMPALKEQERLVLRRTLVQQTTQRASTIYSEQTSMNGGFNGWGSGGGNF